MNALAEFKDYYKHLDEMIAESSKEGLAECVRLLALNVAWHVRQEAQNCSQICSH